MMNIATAVLIQHSQDIYTELVNDYNLSPYRSELVQISEHYQRLNKRLNRLFKQRYSDKVNDICDLTLQQVREARIVSQQYLVSRIKYEVLEQAAKSIQMTLFLHNAQEIYSATSKNKDFKNDIESLIKAVQKYMTAFDCQLNKDEVIGDIDICQPIYKKMMTVIFNEIKK